MLRNNAAVRFVVARFAGLLRSNKSSDEPLVSPFLGEIPAADKTPSSGERPSLDEAPSSGETPGLELPTPGEMPGAANAELPSTAPHVFGESTTAAQSDQSQRNELIRRRWAETGIKMWNADVQGAGFAALTIQGRADLLPAKPGLSRREYDRLEFKLIAGQIVCEGIAVDPPKRRK